MEFKDNLYYEETILAALLHDIGKIIQKSPELYKSKGQHPQLSRDLLELYNTQLSKRFDVNVIYELVQKHHDSSNFKNELDVKNAPQEILPYAWILSYADNFSAKERGSENSNNDYRTRTLDSIFKRVNIFQGETDLLQYSSEVYKAGNCFPKEQLKFDKESIVKHVENFKIEFGKIILAIKEDTPFENIYNSLYNLLQKYMWCIPSDSKNKICDVSLFDHLKTTSAISACMYKYHKSINNFSINSVKTKTTNKFILLVGDLSGIQDYMFLDKQNSYLGMTKKLKARSFNISILLDVISKSIIDTLNLPISNIIMNGGGKFYMLLPNTDKTFSVIDSVNQKVQHLLYTQYQSILSFTISFVEMSGKDFDIFGVKLKELMQNLSQQKLECWKNILTDNQGWKEEMFTIDKPIGSDLCKGCGCEFVANNSELGKNCLKEIEIGSLIPKMIGYEIIKVKNKESDFLFFDNYCVNIITDEKDISQNNFTILVNSETIYYDKNIYEKTVSNYIPKSIKNPNEIITFDEIVENRKGIKRLGYLKMDIDNLNIIFTEGLKKEDKSEIEQNEYNTISRITTLSRMIDMFFSGYVNKIVKEKYNLCYIVYSGGENLIVIGDWNLIINLSIELNNKFKEYVGNNPNITLSTAIEFSHVTTPTIKAINSLNNLLQLSKLKKNQITIFSQTMDFEDLNCIKSECDFLKNLIDKKYITNGDLWKLKKYSKLIKENNIRYKMLIAYDIGRKTKNTNTAEYINWLEELLNGKNAKRTLLLQAIVDLTFMFTRED